MPFPEPPPRPIVKIQAPSMQKPLRQEKAPASKNTHETNVLTTANQIDKQHEVVMTGRHYRFSLPQDWELHDNSYTATREAGPRPGTKEVQFAAPHDAAVSITFVYRGQSIDEEAGQTFVQTLKHLKPHGQPVTLTSAQIKHLDDVFGVFVNQNQISAGEPKDICFPFHMTSCKIITVANNVAALSVSGEYRNKPIQEKPDSYWQEVYLNGGDNGTEVHQIRLTALTKESFDSHKPIFDHLLNNLRW